MPPLHPLPSGAPERRVPGPPFLRRREAPRPLRPPVPLLFNAAGAWCPLGPHGHPSRLRRGAGETKTRGNGRRDPQGRSPANFSSDSLPDVARKPEKPVVPAPRAVPYLRGSCREGRQGSARIPGLIVLPLSPYPSIQLGLFPLASPWKKSLEEKKQKINHAAEKRQPRSAGGSSEPGGSVPLGRQRPARPLPARPALTIHHPVPSNVRAALPPLLPRRPPPRARVSAPPARGRGCWGSWAGTQAARLRRGPRGPRKPRDAGRAAAPHAERAEHPGAGHPCRAQGRQRAS